MSVGLAFYSYSFLFSASQESTYLRVLRMRQQFLRVAAGDHRARFRIEKYAVVADGEDARQLVGDDDDRRAQTVAQLENQIVEQRELIGSSPADGSSKNKISGSSAMARASPARFCMPPLICDG